MVRHKFPLTVFCCWFLLVTLTAFHTFAAEVTIKLDRDSVAVGDAAMLTLRVTGSQMTRPEIPEIENLIVQPRGQQQETQMLNGQVSSSLSLSYLVGSNTAGEYQIPAFEIVVDDQKIMTQAVDLKVLANKPIAPPTGQNPPSAEASPPQQAVPEDPFGFLTVELVGSDRKHVYVGEIAPVCIRAWFPADSRASLRSGIQPEAQAFTLHHVSEQPQQSEETRNGKNFLVVTWYGGISATKSGNYPASLSLKANVAVRDQSAAKPQRRSRGGPFDDPFFDGAFDRMNARYIQKDVTLKSLDQGIEVRALPLEGRPNNFSGAIGEFKLETANIPAIGRTGEPQTIRASISGSGNFALVAAPQLTPADRWKVYPGKDQFTARDEASFSGVKHFEFNAVPRKGGEQEAALSFSYFDPAASEYKVLTSSNTSLRIEGQDLVELKEKSPETVAKPQLPKNQLAIQKHQDGASTSLTPLISTAKFYPLLGSTGGLILAGSLLGFYRQRRQDPRRCAQLAQKQAVRATLQLANEQAAAKNVVGFFTAARRALQEQLGILWNQPPQAITLAEVTQRLGADSPVITFFQEADLYEYSTLTGRQWLPNWKSMLDQALAAIATKK